MWGVIVHGNGGKINGDMMPCKPLWWVVVMLDVIMQHFLMTRCWTDQSVKFTYHCLVAGWIVVWWSITVCPLVCLSIYMYIIFIHFLLKFEWWILFLRHSVCAIFQLVHQSEKFSYTVTNWNIVLPEACPVIVLYAWAYISTWKSPE